MHPANESGRYNVTSNVTSHWLEAFTKWSLNVLVQNKIQTHCLNRCWPRFPTKFCKIHEICCSIQAESLKGWVILIAKLSNSELRYVQQLNKWNNYHILCLAFFLQCFNSFIGSSGMTWMNGGNILCVIFKLRGRYLDLLVREVKSHASIGEKWTLVKVLGLLSDNKPFPEPYDGELAT